MHDTDLRASLRRRVRRYHRGAGTRILEELGILEGRVRVDLVVVNGTLRGYEIKSAADSLRRLPSQVAAYGQVLDYAGLVVAERHLDASLRILPRWWEVVVARQRDHRLRLEVARAGQRNPDVDKRALVELLWHADAIALLRKHAAADRLARAPRARAWDRIVEVCTVDEIRGEVRAQLKRRAVLVSGPSRP